MKFVFLIGGFIGFALATLTGFLAGRSAGFVLRDAAFASLAGGFLFRWFWSVVVKAMADTVAARQREAREKAEAASTPEAAPVPARSR